MYNIGKFNHSEKISIANFFITNGGHRIEK